MSEPTQKCPICECEVRYDGRYPRHVCGNCEKNAVTENGEKIDFGNEGYWGGCVSYVNRLKTEVPIHKCYINGIECYADEARFGGIVIQVAKTHSEHTTQVPSPAANRYLGGISNPQVKIKKEEA